MKTKNWLIEKLSDGQTLTGAVLAEHQLSDKKIAPFFVGSLCLLCAFFHPFRNQHFTKNHRKIYN